MKGYVLRRIGLFIPTILLTTVIVFALFFLVPGDAALFILTGEEGAGAVTEAGPAKAAPGTGLGPSRSYPVLRLAVEYPAR